MFLKAGDIISGQEGKVTATIDGVVEVMAYVKNLEATFEKQKSEIKTLGHRGTQHKTTGWTGTGSMSMYYITSKFRELARKYAKEGIDTYLDVTVVNDDPTSTVGNQTVTLYGVNLDNTILAKLDVDNTELDEDIDFTFDDFEILDSFGTPTYGA